MGYMTMRMVLILQVLVTVICTSLGHAATINACMMVLLSKEFHGTCSTLARNHTRPCLVSSDADVKALKWAKVIRPKMSVPRNKICAARTQPGEADCISVHLKCNPQQNWQWTAWTGTSPNIARRFAVTEGNTNTVCPYEERYFVPEVFSDCLDALNHGMLTSGICTISPDGSTELQVYCEQQLDGGGWTVIQRRQNGSVDFYRTWAEYKAGFGDLAGEHWLGNDYIHLLTKEQQPQVTIRLGSSDGQSTSAYYSWFWIEDEDQKYRLHIGGYSGAAVPGDSMNIRHNGRTFTTEDRDNDGWSDGNCAVRFKGAWWHDSCHYSNLNGEYGNAEFGEGLNWYTWKGHHHSMAYTAIMVKRKTPT